MSEKIDRYRIINALWWYFDHMRNEGLGGFTASGRYTPDGLDDLHDIDEVLKLIIKLGSGAKSVQFKDGGSQ